MAKDDRRDEDEMDDEEQAKPKKGKPILKIIIIVFTVLIMIAGSIGATLYFTGALDGHDSADNSASADGKKDKKSKSSKKKADKAPPTYFAFDPPFVVNFVEGNQIRYLQITLEVMARDPEQIKSVEEHMPLIRNNLVLMFSDLDYDAISSLAGKQKLRDKALEEIRRILKEETGKPIVEAVYFTSFVMQ